MRLIVDICAVPYIEGSIPRRGNFFSSGELRSFRNSIISDNALEIIELTVAIIVWLYKYCKSGWKPDFYSIFQFWNASQSKFWCWPWRWAFTSGFFGWNTEMFGVDAQHPVLTLNFVDGAQRSDVIASEFSVLTRKFSGQHQRRWPVKSTETLLVQKKVHIPSFAVVLTKGNGFEEF